MGGDFEMAKQPRFTLNGLAALRRRLTPYHYWLAGLSLLMLLGLGAGVLVFVRGLVVTGLNDNVPWGLWITVDLSSIALSAGAFSLSAAVYLLGLQQLRPVARVAVFIGLIGYTMALLCLLLDIGRPDRFWHALVFWNIHSVLWEVTMCVALYLSVLSMEFAPLLGEADWLRARFPQIAWLLRQMHHAAPVLAVVGLGLSLLHQSSLGATYGILKARPIWYKPDMSILFITSALTGGPALTVLACLVVGWLRRQAVVAQSLLEGVAKFIGFTLVVYLYLRFWDALSVTYTYAPGRTEGLRLLTGGPFQWNFWVGEILLGAVIPALILLNDRWRAHASNLMLATALVVIGVVLYRWDVNLSGQLMTVSYVPAVVPSAAAVAGLAHYQPTWVEWVSSLGIVSYGLMAFSLGAKYLPVFKAPLGERTTTALPPAHLPEIAGI
jgi:molybdopterin-containing oxidoreductase family membrane subunit